MMINEEGVTKSADAKKQGQKQDHDKGVFDKAGAAFAAPGGKRDALTRLSKTGEFIHNLIRLLLQATGIIAVLEITSCLGIPG
jgi:hypothetical protein